MSEEGVLFEALAYTLYIREIDCVFSQCVQLEKGC